MSNRRARREAERMQARLGPVREQLAEAPASGVIEGAAGVTMLDAFQSRLESLEDDATDLQCCAAYLEEAVFLLSTLTERSDIDGHPNPRERMDWSMLRDSALRAAIYAHHLSGDGIEAVSELTSLAMTDQGSTPSVSPAEGPVADSP